MTDLNGSMILDGVTNRSSAEADTGTERGVPAEPERRRADRTRFQWSSLVLLAPALLLMLYAQWRVSSAYKKWGKVSNSRSLTGAMDS